jgi:hypothetical protein
MKVTATAPRPIQLAADPVAIGVEAHWLFGGKAAGAKTELRCRVEPSEFAPAAQKGFHFGPAGIDAQQPRPLTLDARAASSTSRARARSPVRRSRRSDSLGPATLVADAAVFEGESGRTTVGQARSMLQPEPFAIGLQTGTRRAHRGEPIEVKGIVTDWDGKPFASPPAELTVEVYHLEEEFSWWWDDESEDSRQTRMLRRSRDERRTVPTNGKGRVRSRGDALGGLGRDARSRPRRAGDDGALRRRKRAKLRVGRVGPDRRRHAEARAADAIARRSARRGGGRGFRDGEHDGALPRSDALDRGDRRGPREAVGSTSSRDRSRGRSPCASRSRTCT